MLANKIILTLINSIIATMEAEDIKQLRALLGITQLELSQKLGVSLKTITNYETGGVIPPAKQKLLLTMLTKARNEISHNVGTINTGSVGGHNVSVLGGEYEKIIGKDKIELIGAEAGKIYSQKIGSLEAEIMRLEAIIKSKDETIAAKDETIEILRKK